MASKTTGSTVDGAFAFELFDTYGFSVDLTQLMAREKEMAVDMEAFAKCMEEQKSRSRQAAEVAQEDWVEVSQEKGETRFVGYDTTVCDASILRYRAIKSKGKTEDNMKVVYQLVLDQTPFYAESGGQVGDRGVLKGKGVEIKIENTLKENNLILHIASQLPDDLQGKFTAQVDRSARQDTERNHSATHLLHAALRKVLGSHVEQKGSLVEPSRLRFDFAHFSKMTDEEILQVERLVNAKIREDIALAEHREMPIAEAREMGAVALFGEKYGEHVRVIAFDPGYSIELCGGTHVRATGEIGFFKIVSEVAIAAGIRRVEAVTGVEAENWILEQSGMVSELKEILKGNKDLRLAAEMLVKQNAEMTKQIGALMMEKVRMLRDAMLQRATIKGEVALIVEEVALEPAHVKNLAFELRNTGKPVVVIIASVYDEKPMLTVAITESLAEAAQLDAASIVKEIAAEIKGGGGGQKFYATAGGKDASGIAKALEKARILLDGLALS